MELLQALGHLTGWAVEDASDLAAAAAALCALDAARGAAPLFAVGDGNHSLAAARACWLEIKAALPRRRPRSIPRAGPCAKW